MHWGDDFIFGIPDDRADDLEQLMRVVFKVKICVRIGPGFLTAVEFLHRKVAWNAEAVALGSFRWVTVRTVRMNKKYNNTDPWLAQHCTLGNTDQKRNTQRKKQRDSCLAARVCKHYSEAPVLSWSFQYQEMPSEIRAVADANWAGELEGLRSTSCGWIDFGDHLLETSSSTQQIVALSTAESEYISITNCAAHALEVRSAMVEFELTFKMVCETDASTGRAMATRRGVGRVRAWMRDCCGCNSCAQKACLKFEPGLESKTSQTWEQRWSI